MDSPQLDDTPPATEPAKDQNPGVAIAPIISGRVETGLGAAELSDTLRSLMDAGVRGQSAMMLLQTISGRLEAEIASLRSELREVRRQSEAWQEQFHLEREHRIKLHERLSSLRRGRRIQTLAIALGGIVGGVAGAHLGDDRPWWAVAGSVLGIVLILMGVVGSSPTPED